MERLNSKIHELHPKIFDDEPPDTDDEGLTP
jgi:hypothetical protein